jgi:ABC-type branched-subunit amino acid transport system permease subunit
MLATPLGFVVGFVPAGFIALSADVKQECDGVCFSDWVGVVALAVGGLCAIVFGVAAWRLSNRYFAKPS